MGFIIFFNVTPAWDVDWTGAVVTSTEYIRSVNILRRDQKRFMSLISNWLIPPRSPSDPEKPVQNRVGVSNLFIMLNFFWL